MAKQKKKSKKIKKVEQRSLFLALLIYSTNLLIVLGYLLLLPFEKSIYYLRIGFLSAKDLILKKSQTYLQNKSHKKHLDKIKNALKNLGISKKSINLLNAKEFEKKEKEVKKELVEVKAVEKSKKLLVSAPSIIYKNSIFKNILYFTFGIAFAIFFIVSPIVIYTWFRALPKPELLISQGTNQTTKFLDRNGKLLYEVYVDRKYIPIPLDSIPEHVVQATLSIEDKSFYTHNGFKLTSIMRALVANYKNDGITQGASTLTQQLVKNVLLTSEKTLTRKVKELVLSVLVEQKYTKDQILELYLNNIPYGGTAYGIEAASQKYFGKTTDQLSLAEASLLAGLPAAPTVYSPLNGNPVAAENRQELVLNRMVEDGYITQLVADKAKAKTLNYRSQAEFIKAPHFVNFIRDELNVVYGKRTVDFGGLTITTTLDLDLQNQIQDIVADEVTKNEYLNLSNGAAVVLDVNNGDILAYVGSRDYYSDKIDGKFDVARAFRQPGSSVKPYTYALSLEQGYTAASIIQDVPTAFVNPGSPPYVPKNYNGRFAGNVTLRHALSNSLNIPAVKLMEAIKPDSLILLGQKLGISNWQLGNDYGLSLTLGGKEVRLIDHANAFANFAREGRYESYVGVLSIKDINGTEVFDNSREIEEVLTPESAYLISHILSDNKARVPAFGYRSALEIPGKTVAVKTGTTDENRDNWTMGYSPDYMVGVWVGNNDNTPMNRYLSSGLTGAAPIWNKIMNLMLIDVENKEFVVPDDIFVKIDRSCGERTEVFATGSNIPHNLCPPKPIKKEETEKEDSDDDDDDDN